MVSLSNYIRNETIGCLRGVVQPKNIVTIDAASLKVSTSSAKSAKANLYATAMSQLNDCKCNWNVDAESFRKWLVSHLVKSALSKDQDLATATCQSGRHYRPQISIVGNVVNKRA